PSTLSPRPSSTLLLRSPFLTHRHRTRNCVPDTGGVFRNRSITGEFARTGDVDDRFANPLVLGRVQLADSLLSLRVRRQVRQMHKIIASSEQSLTDRCKDSRLTAAEMIVEDQIQRLAGFRFVLVMPLRAIPAAAALHLFR